MLRERFAEVIWVPGNHELWTHRREPLRLRGVERYEHLVAMCRGLGVRTPEDQYLTWTGPGGPAVIAPLFVLYDYTFLPDGTATRAEALERARATGIIASDEAMLHADPYPSTDAWCSARLAATETRLADLPAGARTVLVNHFPLVRELTRVLRYPVFAQWCGTARTADWPQRFNAVAVVYATCTFRVPRGTTGSAMSRCRSAIRGSGGAAQTRRTSRVRSCRPPRRASRRGRRASRRAACLPRPPGGEQFRLAVGGQADADGDVLAAAPVQRTSWPAARAASVMWRPTKTVPPMIRIRMQHDASLGARASPAARRYFG